VVVVFQVIGLVLRWFPAIWAIVMAMESAVSPTTPGSKKREAAIAAVVVFFRSMKVELTPAQLDGLGKVIDGIVSVFNLVGAFRHRGSMTPEEIVVAEAAGVVEPVVLAAAVQAVAADDAAFARFLESTAR
jgi:hypothetical protein